MSGELASFYMLSTTNHGMFPLRSATQCNSPFFPFRCSNRIICGSFGRYHASSKQHKFVTPSRRNRFRSYFLPFLPEVSSYILNLDLNSHHPYSLLGKRTIASWRRVWIKPSRRWIGGSGIVITFQTIYCLPKTLYLRARVVVYPRALLLFPLH